MQKNTFDIQKLRKGLITAKEFSLLFVRHCKQDKITVSAGHLAFVSLLSLVPFIIRYFRLSLRLRMQEVNLKSSFLIVLYLMQVGKCKHMSRSL